MQRAGRIAGLPTLMLVSVVWAAPTPSPNDDLFDHLATTYPIDDWVMHARNRHNACRAALAATHPRVDGRCPNLIGARASEVSFGTPREILVWRTPSRCRTEPPLLGGPCERAAPRGAAAPSLPDHPGYAPLTLLLPDEITVAIGSR